MEQKRRKISFFGKKHNAKNNRKIPIKNNQINNVIVEESRHLSSNAIDLD